MIYITGDLHGSIDKSKLNTKNFPEQKSLTKNDYLIIAGDFGVIWDNSKEQVWLLKWIASKNFTTLFIDGNHENFDLLNQYPITEWNGGKVHQINDSIYHLMRGQVFTIDNKTIFTFGGAESVDKQYRREFISWWRQELPSQAELCEGIDNLQEQNMVVDFIITHTAPTDVVKELKLDFEKIHDPTSAMLQEFKEITAFKHWYFGHFHTEQTVRNFTALYNNIVKL